jgi:hypothetical protein
VPSADQDSGTVTDDDDARAPENGIGTARIDTGRAAAG